MAVGYPAHREADVVLRDGATIHVRPVRVEDRHQIAQFLRDLSSESRTFRFFSGGVDADRAAGWAVDVDYLDSYGVVATAGAEARIVAHANYVRTDHDRAEVAFTVADAHQGRGIATLLLGHLAEAAQEQGIGVFTASVLPANRHMLGVFRDSGFSVMRTWSEPGVVMAEFPTTIGPEARERYERRDQAAATAAMRGFLSPRSVAVIGAGRRRGTIGAEVFRNLVATGFNGPVYPVNPSSDVVQSIHAYPAVADIPGPVDLAVVVVPAESVLETARQCAEKGVRSLVVISSGFSETGVEGQERQRQLLSVCRGSGMRLIGPNCMGILNTAGDVRLNATFAPEFPPEGQIGFLSQSGALGLAVIDRARSLGLGLSSFVSVGNKADISGNDLIQYWAADDDTSLILLYLESFGNPRKFARITRRVAKAKPILAVKSGRSTAGMRATSSHTGALVAASDVTVDALFRQAGVIRADTLSELFDVASLLATQPPPNGPRVGILTNAGGPGIMCADTCESLSLQVPALPDSVRRQLAGFLPAEASLTNPVDMIASASADDYRQAIDVIARSGAVDALVVIFIPPLVTRPQDVAAAISQAAVSIDRALPILTVFMSAHGVPDELRDGGARLPSYAFPEDAARALSRAVQYGSWRQRPEGLVPELPDVSWEEVSAVIASALQRGPGWLGPDEVAHVLSCYGVPLAELELAATPGEAGRLAAQLGGQVALKAVGKGLLHKTEAHGVRLWLHGEDQVRDAAVAMADEVARSGAEVEGFIVQRMVADGVEMLVGVVHDPSFGPVVVCGAGGGAVELLKDVQVRITPLTDLDAAEMIRSLQTFPLLDGYRNAPKADVHALENVLLRIGVLVDNHPEVAELDCNPVIVQPDGALVVDARIRVEVPRPQAPFGARVSGR